MTTAEDNALQAARHLTALIRSGPPPDDATLMAALDRMLAAYHDISATTPTSSDQDPPGVNYATRYAEIGARFPDYGYYMVADPLDMSSFTTSTGDAIDDLVDILGDLEGALWCAEHAGKPAGIAQLQIFHWHWSGHARELLCFLHARQIRP